jgi:GT2 family glycosyltransferase
MSVVSVIIVSYNVKYFLEQCLHSVEEALKHSGTSYEVIVIDNHSSDSTIEYLQPKFPEIIFHFNEHNTGFSRANNQGWQMAKGDIVLFLNPDTILGENCIKRSLEVLNELKDAGAVGLRMVDGSGVYLKESKRGVPTAEASFYKLSGLIRLFPRSPKIARYYMGHLNDRQNAEVPILAGAYMMVKRAVLELTGGFDEQFFMYGEDVDLSYRIQQAGYKNIYIGDASIIHFKGESTSKDVQYYRFFYKAMEQFSNKHFQKNAWWIGGAVTIVLFFRVLLHYINEFFPRGRKKFKKDVPLKLVIIGDTSQTQHAMEVFTKQAGVKRNIRLATTDISINEVAAYETFDEIAFVAGKHRYQDIIEQVDKGANKGLYWFTAFGSNSIVCSSHANQQGGALVKEQKPITNNNKLLPIPK